MTTYYDVQEQIEKIDIQILNLLADRAKISSSLEEDSIDEDTLADTTAMWIEEAGERGLNEAIMEKMSRLVVLSSKKIEE